MLIRLPILLFALLVATVAATAMPGGQEGLLLLTPAVALLIPLLIGSYPGESSIRSLASWFSKIRLPETGSTALLTLVSCDRQCAGPSFSAANGSRGPPLHFA